MSNNGKRFNLLLYGINYDNKNAHGGSEVDFLFAKQEENQTFLINKILSKTQFRFESFSSLSRLTAVLPSMLLNLFIVDIYKMDKKLECLFLANLYSLV